MNGVLVVATQELAQLSAVISDRDAKVVWFRDPDGNLLSIVQFSP